MRLTWVAAAEFPSRQPYMGSFRHSRGRDTPIDSNSVKKSAASRRRPLASFRYDDDLQRWFPEVDQDDLGDIAVAALQRIVAATEAREKLIKMADRSELGWRVVQHYLADPIADSVDDEKRIKNATKSAATKLKAVQEKKGEYIRSASVFTVLSSHNVAVAMLI